MLKNSKMANKFIDQTPIPLPLSTFI